MNTNMGGNNMPSKQAVLPIQPFSCLPRYEAKFTLNTPGMVCTMAM